MNSSINSLSKNLSRKESTEPIAWCKDLSFKATQRPKNSTKILKAWI